MGGVNSRFATISEAEILKIQEDAARENTEKARKSVVEITAVKQLETFRSDNDYDYDYEIRTWEAGTRL